MTGKPGDITLFDTHAHLDAFRSETELDEAISRAEQAGVNGIVAVGASQSSNTAAVDAARAYPSLVFAAVGFDRDSAASSSDGGNGDGIRQFDELVSELETCVECTRGDGIRIVAIGEIGIDLHYTPETKREQIALFESQLKLARNLKLPVIVHCRDAFDVVMPMLESHAMAARESVRGGVGVIHCFTGSRDDAAAAVQAGYFLGFSGIVTYRNATQLAEVSRLVPNDHLLLETDTPYLTPEPFRGVKRNEPALLVHVAAKLAELRDCRPEEIAELTSRNARRLFDIT